MEAKVYLIGEQYAVPEIIDKEIELIEKIKPRTVLLEQFGDFNENLVKIFTSLVSKYNTLDKILQELRPALEEHTINLIIEEITSYVKNRYEDELSSLHSKYEREKRNIPLHKKISSKLFKKEYVTKEMEEILEGIQKLEEYLRKIEEGALTLDPKYLPVPKYIEVKISDVSKLPIYLINSLISDTTLWSYLREAAEKLSRGDLILIMIYYMTCEDFIGKIESYYAKLYETLNRLGCVVAGCDANINIKRDWDKQKGDWLAPKIYELL